MPVPKAPEDSTFDQSFGAAQDVIKNLTPHLGHISFGDDPRSFDKPTTDNPDALKALVEAVSVFEGLPGDHLSKIGEMAVAQRNSEAIDYMDDVSQQRTIFAERFTLSLMSEEQREKVLGSS